MLFEYYRIQENCALEGEVCGCLNRERRGDCFLFLSIFYVALLA